MFIRSRGMGRPKKKKGLTIFLVFINIPYGRYTFFRRNELFFLRWRRKGWDITGGDQNEDHRRPSDRALRDAGHSHCYRSDFPSETRTRSPEGSEISFFEVISNDSSSQVRHLNIPGANQKAKGFPWPLESPLLRIQALFSRVFPRTHP
jgi:hypothetical protein